MKFYKFDGAGNDFVLVDVREHDPHLSCDDVAHICHRRFGVGADGLMTLGNASDEYDFVMHYYNSDGHPADMCGNGGRCIALFAHLLGLGSFSSHQAEESGRPQLRFLAADGPHDAVISSWDEASHMGVVQLSMRDVPKNEVSRVLDGCLLNTGVPHYVQKVTDLEHFDVVGEGRRLRHHPDMGPEGANVNFIEEMPDGTLMVRTYERGVEDETWACGTGVTACAIVTGCNHICARGGNFKVSFRSFGDVYTDVQLTGPVSLNFIGEWEKYKIFRHTDFQTHNI